MYEQEAVGPIPDIAKRINATLPSLAPSGEWACDLSDNRLSWSRDVYNIFGFPNGAIVSRDEAVACYCEESRAAMEKLRAHAIQHRRGFTLDVEIQPVRGARHWMRLIAAPVCVDDKVIKLEGLKFLIES